MEIQGKYGKRLLFLQKQANNKQASEYIRRLVNRELPEMKVEMNYSESKSTESDGCSLLMVKKYWHNYFNRIERKFA